MAERVFIHVIEGFNDDSIDLLRLLWLVHLLRPLVIDLKWLLWGLQCQLLSHLTFATARLRSLTLEHRKDIVGRWLGFIGLVCPRKGRHLWERMACLPRRWFSRR